MPPDRCFGIVVGEVGQAHQRHVASTISARSAAGVRVGARACSPNSMLPRTVSHGKTPYSWKITPRSGPGPATGWPSSRTRPARRLDEAADDVHQGRLAAARRADDRDELALADLEADAVDHAHRPGRGREVDRRRRRSGCAPARPTRLRSARQRIIGVQSRCREQSPWSGRAAHAIRSCQATSRRVAARSAQVHRQRDQADADDADVDDVELEERRRVLDQRAEALLRRDQLRGDQRRPGDAERDPHRGQDVRHRQRHDHLARRSRRRSRRACARRGRRSG